MSTRFALCLPLLLIGLAPATVFAATITVDTTTDDPAMGCTLREALASADADAAAGNGCADGSGADRVVVPAGTYAIDSEIQITSEVAIVGAGSDTTVLDAGSASHRIFDIASGARVRVSNLRLTHGAGDTVAGALGVESGGSVTLERLRIDHNTSRLGGAIRITYGGRLSIFDSELDHNTATGSGGAIENNGDLVVERCGFHDNDATNQGGAIHVQPNSGLATTEIRDSLFAMNSATNHGGALASSFDANDATTAVFNSTFSGNSSAARGGAINVQGGSHELTLSGVTVTGNDAATQGGGVVAQSGGTLAVTNSIVAGNTASTAGPDCWMDTATVPVEHHNLLGDSTDCAIFTDATDVVGTGAGILPLADNGGRTFTHALDPSSPARGAGDCVAADGSILLHDQRGVPRTAAGACTLGAWDPFAALALSTDEPAGANCAHGGTKLETGIDVNDDGTLEPFEVTSTEYVCVDLSGAELVDVATEPAGSNCAQGGLRVDSGTDLDGDGNLQPGEVVNTYLRLSTTYQPRMADGSPRV